MEGLDKNLLIIRKNLLENDISSLNRLKQEIETNPTAYIQKKLQSIEHRLTRRIHKHTDENSIYAMLQREKQELQERPQEVIVEELATINTQLTKLITELAEINTKIAEG